MKIIIPMAGRGSRFADAGYTDPKPFIDINGKSMIRRVIDSVHLPQHEHVFICRKEHTTEYNIGEIFSHLNFKIMSIDNVTEGAAITVGMARQLFEYDEDILIVNSDQLFHYDSSVVEDVRNSSTDGCMWCFYGSSPKWSYAKVDEFGQVIEVAEKKQISNIATGGMYYFKSYFRFLECLDDMIHANDRTNNEFYVAPVYNYLIQKNANVQIRWLDHIDQLGTPEDLKTYEDKIRIY